MDAVMLLGEVEPGHADRPVGPRRKLLLVLAVVDVPEQVGLVMERRQEGVGRRLPRAERQRIIASSPSSPGIARRACRRLVRCTLSTPSRLSTTTWSPAGWCRIDVELGEHRRAASALTLGIIARGRDDVGQAQRLADADQRGRAVERDERRRASCDSARRPPRACCDSPGTRAWPAPRASWGRDRHNCR